MDIMSALEASFLSPMVLAFLLGVFAAVVKSDLKFPDGMYIGLTIYLLFAIGLKGGHKLAAAGLGEVIGPLLLALVFCIAIPVWSYFILRSLGRFSSEDAAALGAHYGCVSAVTFSSALVFLESAGVFYEGFMPALLAVMEVPAIIVALFIVRKKIAESEDEDSSMGAVMHELLTGKSTILLLGGLMIGALITDKGYNSITPLFDVPFAGALTLFLLDAGIVAGRRINDIIKAGWFLPAFAIVMPVIHAMLALLASQAVGLSLGGAVVFATLAASASYIAAPAAMRIALPAANPGYYLTASLAITFPFNVIAGIPFYHYVAEVIYA